MSAEVVILHVCPHCEQVFTSSSVCMASGKATEERPVTITSEQLAQLNKGQQGSNE